MSQITTHILDTSLGRPASGVPVGLDRRVGDDWAPVAAGTTDADGRVGDLGPAALPQGTYRIRFDTSAYYAADGRDSFFPEILVVFELADASHCHVPLLLSPFGYSTYRGS